MATSYFTRIAFSLMAHRPSIFSQFFALKAVGQHINIAAFSDFYGFGMTDSPGLYFVDSVVFHADNSIELGLIDSNREHIGYYYINDITIG